MDHIYKFLKELQPFELLNSSRIRLGSDADGGYVLLDRRLEDIEVIYSYGVGNNYDFELMFCEKYDAIARLFDHTIDKPSFKKDFFHFKKEGVGSKKTEHLNTIENHIKQYGDRNKKLILKMDVEGAEWDVLYHTPSAILELFEQIIIEIHFLHSIKPNYDGINLSKSRIDKKTNVIRNINKLFYLYHVHANNYEPLFYIDQFKLPNTMELTFVNKKYFKLTKNSKTIFPTEFDRPSWEKREEINLHFWPFYPGIIPHISHIVTQVGWEKWKQIVNLIYKRFETKVKSMLIKMNLRRPTTYS